MKNRERARGGPATEAEKAAAPEWLRQMYGL